MLLPFGCHDNHRRGVARSTGRAMLLLGVFARALIVAASATATTFVRKGSTRALFSLKNLLTELFPILLSPIDQS